MSTDNEIMRRSRDRPGAFAELFDRHARTIHRYVARRLGAEAADDVMSETFLVAFERRAAFDDSPSALPWLLGIATRLIAKHARLEARAWRGLRAADLGRVEHDQIDRAADRMDAERLAAKVGSALRRLPAGDRDVLLLYAWGDLDYQGVAAALEIPVGTVRSRLNRARRRLRIAIDPGSAREEVDHGRVVPAATDSH
ncbi:RNA polymerase sigma factor [Microbacterium sp. SORGH_AS_0888]|uniref:RNA polymerase sigma factor n=1 Tax=Microbacterium sp. SORGH_AS_0888 TaxID=3041791 RepID=UPI002785FF6C|nr:sigma-70 family RNA polymerase sigma factor [Microbacterium sp. SORGH_AS_0888]MDQ1130726.1 RNA polymerase sigma factor (sigma-70 family) [Microbacterium sp. SORGH_AS_0888]